MFLTSVLYICAIINTDLELGIPSDDKDIIAGKERDFERRDGREIEGDEGI